MRLALSSEVTVVIDERDEVALGEQDSDEVMIEQVRISQRVSFNSCPYGKLKINATKRLKSAPSIIIKGKKRTFVTLLEICMPYSDIWLGHCVVFGSQLRLRGRNSRSTKP